MWELRDLNSFFDSDKIKSITKPESVTPTAVTRLAPKQKCASPWLPTVPIKTNHAESSERSGNIISFVSLQTTKPLFAVKLYY